MSAQPKPTLSRDGERTLALLERHPMLKLSEMQSLRETSRRLPLSDLEQIWEDERLARKMIQYHQARAQEMAPPPYGLLALIAGTVLIIGLLSQITGWLA